MKNEKLNGFDPLELDALIKKQKEIDERMAQEHPDIKALQDVDNAISDIVDAAETAKEAEIKKSIEEATKVYEVETEEVVKTMRQFHGSDLPLYFQWLGGTRTWLYKVYVKEGKLKADKIVFSHEDKEIEYTSVQPTSAFKNDHIPVDACVWNEALELIYRQVNHDK